MPVTSSKISPTLTALLNELRDECLSAIKLIHQVELEHLTDEQIEELLGESDSERIPPSITHLNVHSGMVKEELDKE